MLEVDLTLVSTQKNAILRILWEKGFVVEDFAWQTTTHDEIENDAVKYCNKISVLVHKPTRFFFQFDKYRSIYCPAYQLRTGIEEWNRLIDREEHFRNWLSSLSAELFQPDLWAQIYGQVPQFDTSSFAQVENRPFTPDERIAIAERLQEIKSFLIAAQHFNQEQLTHIEQQVAYLNEASNRLGRRDWMNTAVGVFFTVAGRVRERKHRRRPFRCGGCSVVAVARIPVSFRAHHPRPDPRGCR